jgi:hypothetical protein
VPSWVISGLSLLPAFAVRHPVCIRPSCTSWSRRLSRTAPGRGLDHAPPWWVTSPPPQGPSLGSGLFCPGPSSLNRPHPPHSQVHRDFTACRLIRDAFAVRERLGDPRAVPGFRCSFLPGMPSSPTPGRPASKCSRASMPTWPSPFDHRLGTPKIPAIRSTRASHFVASLVRFRYGLPGCSPPYTDQTGTPQPSGTFTSRLSTDRSPSPPLDITTTATGLLVWGFFCQGVSTSTAYLSSFVSLCSSSRPATVASRRAQELSRLVASSATTRSAWAPSTAAPSNAVGLSAR